MFKNAMFNSVQVKRPKRNTFDLSKENKTSMNMGTLHPIYVQEVLPGDSFSVQSENLIRFAPMLAPIMHRVNIYTHYFFVPNRILWDNFQDFISNSPDEPVHPFCYVGKDVNQLTLGSLGELMGLPEGEYTNKEKVNLFPIAAYDKIHDEFYRDQNLQEELYEPLVDGENNNYFLHLNRRPHRRAWEHDYFTSCLPFTQKGDDVMLSIDSEGNIPVDYDYNSNDVLIDNAGNPIPPISTMDLTGASTVTGMSPYGAATEYDDYVNLDNSANLSVDLSGTHLITINELRKAIALQRYLELNARGGTRYTEFILAHFGVKSSDARLQRPEYLGGGMSRVAISEVLQMSQSETTPQGTMSGHGISVGQTHGFKKFFEEYGYVIGIMSIMPKTAYQQGIPKHYQRFDKFDYYLNSFAHLGEQAVLNKELFAQHSKPDDVFGYLPRYAEYKTAFDEVHGDFKKSLDFWHLGRIFEPGLNEPNLNKEFIMCEPSNRIFAVEDGVDHIWADIFIRVYATRGMPVFGTPMLEV